MKNLVFLTGAGISAESGIKTFRDSNGLWEEYDVMEVASIEGWHKNPKLVLSFYNQRRRQLAACQPNRAHQILAELEDQYRVHIVTQNVDDLHERAGSRHVLHLHGELTKACSTENPNEVLDIGYKDLNWGDLCSKGKQLRPFIVWFGEMVPALEEAIEIVSRADLLCIIGTSLNVYPAAGLYRYAPAKAPIWLIDPAPADSLPR
ncbi:MAG: NAD-dependent deacylase, partial [Marinilabiliales bacterium]|nr:NAD-dependent deacylase [Marinilabiliales bacterium]